MLVLIKALLHERNTAMIQKILDLPIREKRRIFTLIRQRDLSLENHNFVTCDGFTFAEFCVAYSLK
jgi:hypothetical protein